MNAYGVVCNTEIMVLLITLIVIFTLINTNYIPTVVSIIHSIKYIELMTAVA